LQEYFATAFVQRCPAEVSDRELLLEPRWRETAVVLLRATSGPKLDSLLALIATALADPISELQRNGFTAPESSEASASAAPINVFPWPASTLQIMSIV
jgi:hypothetical protein